MIYFINPGRKRRRNPGRKHLAKATAKQQRQYEHIKASYLKRGKSAKTAKRIAAATVRKGAHLVGNPSTKAKGKTMKKGKKRKLFGAALAARQKKLAKIKRSRAAKARVRGRKGSSKRQVIESKILSAMHAPKRRRKAKKAVKASKVKRKSAKRVAAGKKAARTRAHKKAVRSAAAKKAARKRSRKGHSMARKPRRRSRSVAKYRSVRAKGRVRKGRGFNLRKARRSILFTKAYGKGVAKAYARRHKMYTKNRKRKYRKNLSMANPRKRKYRKNLSMANPRKRKYRRNLRSVNPRKHRRVRRHGGFFRRNFAGGLVKGLVSAVKSALPVAVGFYAARALAKNAGKIPGLSSVLGAVPATSQAPLMAGLTLVLGSVLTSKVKQLQKYKSSVMVGLGLNLVHTLITSYNPGGIAGYIGAGDYISVPTPLSEYRYDMADYVETGDYIETGAFEDMAEYEDMAAEQDLGDSVNRLGQMRFQPAKKLMPHFASSQAVMPHWSPSMSEGDQLYTGIFGQSNGNAGSGGWGRGRGWMQDE